MNLLDLIGELIDLEKAGHKEIKIKCNSDLEGAEIIITENLIDGSLGIWSESELMNEKID